MVRLLEWLHSIVCGVPSLIMILGVGIYLSFRCRFIQIRCFPEAMRSFWKQLTGKRAADS